MTEIINGIPQPVNVGEKYVKATWFATAGSGTTSGTVTKPSGAGVDVSFVSDEWGTDTDALVSKMANGKPTWKSPVDAGGSTITTTFNTSGEFAFSGTPVPADDHAVVFVYKCYLKNFDVDESLFESELVPAVPGSDHTIASHSDTTATGAELETLTDGSDAGDIHIHDARYFTETEHLNSSGGAGDAGKPIKLDASGKVDTTMIPAHATSHTDGTDDIQSATSGQKGLATAAQITKLDAIEALADVTDAVNVAISIHGVAEKATPVDADEVGLIDSAAANVLKKLTWANLKATLKTYFDTLYNLYSHPNHTGAVTSTGDGATAITDKAVALAKMADMATASLLGRNTAATGVPEVLSKATAQSLLNVEDGATADQTGAEIKTLYEAEANAFTDTKNTKLAGIESGATKYPDTGEQAFLDADHTKLDGIEAGARVGILDADAIKWAIVFGG